VAPERPTGRSVALADDDRAVSTAVTHVLAIGISTILVSSLLIGASGVLNDQQERAARQELQTIGNRIATQITLAERAAGASGTPPAVIRIDQPARVSGGSYNVRLDSGGCDPPFDPPGAPATGCLELATSAPGLDVTVQVPVSYDDTAVDVDLEQPAPGRFEVVVVTP
jgi:type II secretory pathway pseudopilin PulG